MMKALGESGLCCCRCHLLSIAAALNSICLDRRECQMKMQVRDILDDLMLAATAAAEVNHSTMEALLETIGFNRDYLRAPENEKRVRTFTTKMENYIYTYIFMCPTTE
jgi:hypothetical protein